MSLPDVRPQPNLLSEFVLAIVGALGLGVPIAAAIIWICSWSLCRFLPPGRASMTGSPTKQSSPIRP